MKRCLLGPEAMDVSNDVLISILCNIGCAADKIADKSDFLGSYELCDAFATIIEKSRYKVHFIYIIIIFIII